MVEGLIHDVSLVIAGGLITLMVSIMSEKRKRNIRCREIALLLAKEIEIQIEALVPLIECVNGLTNNKEKKEKKIEIEILKNISNFYTNRAFIALLPEMSKLPLECVEKIFIYHRIANIYSKNLIAL